MNDELTFKEAEKFFKLKKQPIYRNRRGKPRIVGYHDHVLDHTNVLQLRNYQHDDSDPQDKSDTQPSGSYHAAGETPRGVTPPAKEGQLNKVEHKYHTEEQQRNDDQYSAHSTPQNTTLNLELCKKWRVMRSTGDGAYVYAIHRIPGLFILPAFVSPEIQAQLLTQSLTQFPNHPSTTNHTPVHGQLSNLFQAAQLGLVLPTPRAATITEPSQRPVGQKPYHAQQATHADASATNMIEKDDQAKTDTCYDYMERDNVAGTSQQQQQQQYSAAHKCEGQSMRQIQEYAPHSGLEGSTPLTGEKLCSSCRIQCVEGGWVSGGGSATQACYTSAKALLLGLRWCTLGPPFDWTNRRYITESPQLHENRIELLEIAKGSGHISDGRQNDETAQQTLSGKSPNQASQQPVPAHLKQLARSALRTVLNTSYNHVSCTIDNCTTCQQSTCDYTQPTTSIPLRNSPHHHPMFVPSQSPSPSSYDKQTRGGGSNTSATCEQVCTQSVNPWYARMADVYTPDAALINYYRPRDVLGGHCDDVEADMAWPLVSVTLGGGCIFLAGTGGRDDAALAVRLGAGDVVVLAGQARLMQHGVPCVFVGDHEPSGVQSHFWGDLCERIMIDNGKCDCAGK